jgi:hypothetical protein
MNNVVSLQQQANNVSAPSIASSAMLCELSISQWAGRKKDKRASEQVAVSAHAKRGAASVNKMLLADCQELIAIGKFVAQVRQSHYAMTMPWSDTGLRLLPTTQYFKYSEQITALRNEFDRLVDEFLQAYTWEMTRAQLSLGDLFDADDYPTVESLRGKFDFRINYIPLPETGDFRIDVGNEQKQVLQEHYANTYNRFLETSMRDIWQRTYDALTTLCERIDWNEGEQRKRLHDSTFDKVFDMIDMLQSCNLTGDSQMETMRLQLEDAFRGVTAERLKEDGHMRAETRKAVQSALKNIPSLDM